MPSKEDLYEQAEKLKDAGDLEAAAAKCQECLQQDANYALAHSMLAVVLTKLKRHDEAIQHAIRVCQIEPNDPFSFTALSVTCQRAGRIPEAEDAMARARMIQQGM
jgi:Flp pilus assembly protein TadD